MSMHGIAGAEATTPSTFAAQMNMVQPQKLRYKLLCLCDQSFCTL